MIDTDGRHEIELGVAKRNLQRVWLNTDVHSGDLPHHACGNIATRGLLEIGVKETKQLSFSATHVQITEAGGGHTPALEEPPDQVGFATMEEYRLTARETGLEPDRAAVLHRTTTDGRKGSFGGTSPIG